MAAGSGGISVVEAVGGKGSREEAAVEAGVGAVVTPERRKAEIAGGWRETRVVEGTIAVIVIQRRHEGRRRAALGKRRSAVSLNRTILVIRMIVMFQGRLQKVKLRNVRAENQQATALTRKIQTIRGGQGSERLTTRSANEGVTLAQILSLQRKKRNERANCEGKKELKILQMMMTNRKVNREVKRKPRAVTLMIL